MFSTDGDGDRPLVSVKSVNWLRGDILGLLTSDALNIEALATPVGRNTAIEAKRFPHMKRTKTVDSTYYICAEFANLAKKYGSVAGFEANGGFIFLGSDVELNNQQLKALPTRCGSSCDNGDGSTRYIYLNVSKELPQRLLT